MKTNTTETTMIDLITNPVFAVVVFAAIYSGMLTEALFALAEMVAYCGVAIALGFFVSAAAVVIYKTTRGETSDSIPVAD